MTSAIDVAGPLHAYRSRVAGHDELAHAERVGAPHWDGLAAAYARFGMEELQRRRVEIERLLERDGVTYNVSSDPGRRIPRPWVVDPVPLVLPAPEWRTIEAGVAQRAALLDAIGRDLYGERRLLTAGIVPPAMLLGDPQFSRVCDSIVTPGPADLVSLAVDLARGPDGAWVALGHRTQAPSGAAYALENRRVMTRVFPVVHRETDVARLAPYVRALRSALRRAAPVGVEDPAIVVLTPGSRSETAFEHASVAALLGLPLVQGADLEVRGGRLWLRTVDDIAPVHVVLRRVDAGFCDPLELRPDSTLGVAGLVDVCRSGHVTVVNSLGAGVLENAGLAGYLPALCRHLLGEELSLPSPSTWWCGEPTGLAHVRSRLGHIIVRPLSRLGAAHSVDTRRLDASALDRLRRRIEHRPEQWVGQEWIEPASTPVLTDAGLEPRPTVLRSFAVAGADGYVVMAGGLARAGGGDPLAPIAGRTGAIAKDTWVLADEAETIEEFWLVDPTQTVVASRETLAARAAANFFWLGRYGERVEATARLLRVVIDRRDEFDNAIPGPGPAALHALLEATTRVTGTYPGFVGDDAGDRIRMPEDELWSLAIDEQRPGTLAHGLIAMFDNIDELRDQLSIDTSLALAELQRSYDQLSEQGPRTQDRDEAMVGLTSDLVGGLLGLAGLIDTSMVRDQGWHLLDAGRRIERALQVTALLGATLAAERTPAVESLVLESVLIAGESIITYRRRYRSRAATASVIELLLSDASNPRSVAFQLPRILDDLEQLGRGHEGSPIVAGLDVAASAIGDARSLIDGVDLDALARTDEYGARAELVALGSTLGASLRRSADAIDAAAFVPSPPQQSLLAPAEISSPRDAYSEGST